MSSGQRIGVGVRAAPRNLTNHAAHYREIVVLAEQIGQVVCLMRHTSRHRRAKFVSEFGDAIVLTPPERVVQRIETLDQNFRVAYWRQRPCRIANSLVCTLACGRSNFLNCLRAVDVDAAARGGTRVQCGRRLVETLLRDPPSDARYRFSMLETEDHATVSKPAEVTASTSILAWTMRIGCRTRAHLRNALVQQLERPLHRNQSPLSQRAPALIHSAPSSLPSRPCPGGTEDSAAPS